MRISFRALVNRLATYPVLLPLMPIYALAENKKVIFDAFYAIRGLPHGWLKGKTRIAFYNGFTIVFPLDEDPSFDDVWLRNVYYPYKPKSDHVVLDIGAHMGFFSLNVVRSVKRIIAVEPDPVNFEFLTANIDLNRIQTKVNTLNLAAGEKNGRAFLNRCQYGYGRSKISVTETVYPIQMRTVDSLVQEMKLERVDLMKIDTEGYEPSVLKGARNTLKVHRPDLLLAAYHFGGEPRILANTLRQLGYSVFGYRVPLFLSQVNEFYLYARVTSK